MRGDDLRAGDVLGPYQLVRRLGAGGMGEVFLARDSRLRRDVALKSLHPTLAHKPRFATQLLREARAVARLNHPNVAQVFDVLDVHGRTLIVMEYLEGETLAQRIRRRGPDSPLETVSLGTQMASALAHAHSHGILHCDLKPGNVFVTRDGVVKVLDFGLARVIDAEAGVSDPGLGATPTMLEMRAGAPRTCPPNNSTGDWSPNGRTSTASESSSTNSRAVADPLVWARSRIRWSRRVRLLAFLLIKIFLSLCDTSSRNLWHRRQSSDIAQPPIFGPLWSPPPQH